MNTPAEQLIAEVFRGIIPPLPPKQDSEEPKPEPNPINQRDEE